MAVRVSVPQSNLRNGDERIRGEAPYYGGGAGFKPMKRCGSLAFVFPICTWRDSLTAFKAMAKIGCVAKA